MKTAEELHTQHIEVISEIEFLKKDLNFLLKILRNCYSPKVNTEKTKLLDSFWKSFECTISKLDTINKHIGSEENEIAYLYKNELIGPSTTLLEDPFISAVKRINEEVKVLKNNFYEFMQGCNECAYKSA